MGYGFWLILEVVSSLGRAGRLVPAFFIFGTRQVERGAKISTRLQLTRVAVRYFGKPKLLPRHSIVHVKCLLRVRTTLKPTVFIAKK